MTYIENRSTSKERRFRNALQIQIVLFLLLIAFSIRADLPSKSSWPYVPPGIEYIHKRMGDQPWAIHIVKVDRSRREFRLVTSLAKNQVVGLATVQTQVDSVPAEWGKPVLAVNGDFFVIRPGPYQGDPAGLHIVEGELVSIPKGTSFWIDVNRHPHIGEVYCRVRITGPGDFDVNVGLNEQCGENEAVLYSPTLGSSTRTSACCEYVLAAVDADQWLPLQMGCCYRAQIKAIHYKGDTIIHSDTMVLSIGSALHSSLTELPVGTNVQVITTSSPSMEGVNTAIGGGPILIQNGKARSWEGNQPRHPRTVLGYNNKYFFFVVVDGRQEGLSIGMNYPELTSLMRELDCTDAMNMDGGGSSTLWLNGHIMNHPSDGRERSVANSLILLLSR
ncbi:MAG: phosphodiester glycosidase family protein [Sedimentisphaerales bacterium]|nr:phosphodiester glycosidase family protein [Sedimentisphaerales bacterium]